MSQRPRPPEFLERKSYRLRRLMDAARFLPIFGLILLLLPLMRQGGDGDDPRVAQEAVYLFAVWIGLVGAAFLMSIGLRLALPAPTSETPSRAAAADPVAERPQGPDTQGG